MIELASITPVADFDLSLTGGTIMLLTHLVLKYPEYAEKARNYKGYKILDNSLIELGGALDIDTVLKAAELADADEIVLPDVFEDGPNTLLEVQKALVNLKNYYQKHPETKHYKLMAVAQGINPSQFATCFVKLANIEEIDVIGIPKANRGRLRLERLYEYTDKEIHFLGCPESLDEVRQMSDYLRKRVRSIDTCIPALNSNLTDDAWVKRPTSYTINLEIDRVNRTNYALIMNEFDRYIKSVSN